MVYRICQAVTRHGSSGSILDGERLGGMDRLTYLPRNFWCRDKHTDTFDLTLNHYTIQHITYSTKCVLVSSGAQGVYESMICTSFGLFRCEVRVTTRNREQRGTRNLIFRGLERFVRRPSFRGTLEYCCVFLARSTKYPLKSARSTDAVRMLTHRTLTTGHCGNLKGRAGSMENQIPLFDQSNCVIL